MGRVMGSPALLTQTAREVSPPMSRLHLYWLLLWREYEGCWVSTSSILGVIIHRGF